MSGESAVTKKAKDWHSSKHIHKRAQYLLEHPDEQIPSDVTFLVGDGQSEPQKTFKCHKFILAMVSSVFQAWFYGSLTQPKTTYEIPDVTPAAFHNMLRYAYGEIIDWDDDLGNALDTLYCAKQYLIDKLARGCRDHIQLDIAVFDTDPCVVFQRAPQMDEENLATLALTRIALRASQVMKEDGLPRLSFDCLKRILDYPHLDAKETEIYQGVRRWVVNSVGVVTGSTLRDAFGSLLYSIRFPLFSATELSNGPVADGVLTGDEASSIFQFLFADVKPTLAFLTIPRSPFPRFVCICCDLLTASTDELLGGFISNELFIYVHPDLAPACCAFFQRLVEDELHIRIASYDNEHVGRTVPLPAGLPEERNILSHSLSGACWFEWDMDGGAARNVRIEVARKPQLYHSAVFGFVLGEKESGHGPFDLWDDKRVKGVVDFRIQ